MKRISLADELTHVVCCDDREGVRALCGIDVSSTRWGDDQPMCAACAASETGGSCPFRGRCRLEAGAA